MNISEEDSRDNAENTIEGIFSDKTILYFKMHSQINKEPACFSIIACEIMECVLLVVSNGVWYFWHYKNINQWTLMNILVDKTHFL